LLVWALPLAIVVAGVAAGVVAVRRWTAGADPPAPAGTANAAGGEPDAAATDEVLTPEDRALLRSALQNADREQEPA
jgi:uncharacterized membrane protein